MKQKNNINCDQLENLNNEQENLIKYKISHLVSANRLKVYIRIDLIDKESEINFEEILNYIKELNIVYGIQKNDIIEYCEKKEFNKELVAVIGTESIDGKDAVVVYDFDMSKENEFIEKEDGTVDYKNLNNIKNIKKNETLCHIIPSQEGVNGMDVYGNVIQYRTGKHVNFNNGKNTYITEDGLYLKSSVEGCVKLLNDKVFVEDVYKVNNVDNETGNIDFMGSVIVNGDVKSGFSVKAKNDIKVRGLVEGAYIEAGNDIIINKGINGMGKGTVYAKGNITSKYIENAIIKSDKNIYAEVLINSDVTAKECIILKGKNSVILGGICKANKTIYAKTIGSKINPETNLIIDLGNYQQEQSLFEKRIKEKLDLEKKISNKEKEFKDIDDKIDLVTKSNIENKNLLRKSLIFKKLELNNDINDLKKQLETIIPTDDITNHKIICRGIMYTNTRIAIGGIKYKVRHDISYSKIYNDGNDISILTLNPSDII